MLRSGLLAVLCACGASATTLTYSDGFQVDTGELPVTQSSRPGDVISLPGIPDLPGQTFVSVTMSLLFYDPQLTYTIMNPTQGALPYCVDYHARVFTFGPVAQVFVELDEGELTPPEVCGTIEPGETITGEYLGAPGFIGTHDWGGGWLDLPYPPFHIETSLGATISDGGPVPGNATTKLGGTWRRSARFEAVVTYEFVPEPSTYALVGVGLLALGWSRSPRNRCSARAAASKFIGCFVPNRSN